MLKIINDLFSTKKKPDNFNKPIGKIAEVKRAPHKFHAMKKCEIYVALAGISGVNSNLEIRLFNNVNIVNVGIISFYVPFDEYDKNDQSFSESYKSTFSYYENYTGPVIDPINLNYRNNQRTFLTPPSLLKEGLLRIFSDCVPSGSGRQRLNKHFPEIEGFNDLKLLYWLASGGSKESINGRPKQGFASGAMLFFTQYPGDEINHKSLESIGEFRAKCFAELAGMAIKFSSKELSASIIHGGAQPKTTYYDETGEIGRAETHYIVKFSDIVSEGNARIEHASLELARASGINVAKSIVVRIISNNRFVADLFLIERYDRFTDTNGNDCRCHRLSALSLTNPNKVKRQDDGDYSDIFNAIRSISSNPEADCREMFRRLLFNIGVNNTDDHLKNHEFVHNPKTNEWRLSPAYDINPNVYPYPHATAIAGFTNGVLTRDYVTSIAMKLNVNLDVALETLDNVTNAINNWHDICVASGCNQNDLNFISKAIDNHGKLAKQKYGFLQNDVSKSEFNKPKFSAY